MFEFSADTQYVFKITIDGMAYLVAFSERNQFGNSVFMTRNGKIAEKIRRTSMFKRGAIRETTPEVGATKREAAPAETAPEKKPKKEESNVKEFANITLAREWLCRTFGVKKSAIRYPGQVAKCAKEHKIEIKYTEE